MTGIALHLALRGLDAVSARLELASRHLSRQVGGAVAWACALWGVR